MFNCGVFQPGRGRPTGGCSTDFEWNARACMESNGRMKLVSVNVAEPVQVVAGNARVLTGIFKSPISGPVAVRRRNLAGDRQADLRVHGGLDKAVYAYPHEHYAHWQAELGRDDFSWGQFGENLTTEGLLENDVRIGDRYAIGSCLLEVSQPRFPCYKLGIRMNDPAFVKQFFASRRVGFYLRVIGEGTLEAGEAIERVAAGTETIRDVYEVTFNRPCNAEAQQRLLDDSKLAGAWKDVIRDFS